VPKTGFTVSGVIAVVIGQGRIPRGFSSLCEAGTNLCADAGSASPRSWRCEINTPGPLLGAAAWVKAAHCGAYLMGRVERPAVGFDPSVDQHAGPLGKADGVHAPALVHAE